jgi:hypothetical protein
LRQKEKTGEMEVLRPGAMVGGTAWVDQAGLTWWLSVAAPAREKKKKKGAIPFSVRGRSECTGAAQQRSTTSSSGAPAPAASQHRHNKTQQDKGAPGAGDRSGFQVGTAGQHHPGRVCACPPERGKFQLPPSLSVAGRHRLASLSAHLASGGTASGRRAWDGAANAHSSTRCLPHDDARLGPFFIQARSSTSTSVCSLHAWKTAGISEILTLVSWRQLAHRADQQGPRRARGIASNAVDMEEDDDIDDIDTDTATETAVDLTRPSARGSGRQNRHQSWPRERGNSAGRNRHVLEGNPGNRWPKLLMDAPPPPLLAAMTLAGWLAGRPLRWRSATLSHLGNGPQR